MQSKAHFFTPYADSLTRRAENIPAQVRYFSIGRRPPCGEPTPRSYLFAGKPAPAGCR